MSKFKARSKKAAPVVATKNAPVAVAEVGRTIVDIARELKITPQNARRVARKIASDLGHSAKGARWFLNADQEKALRDALTAEKPAAQ
jgi:predicted transcriptional regulator